MSQKNKNIDMQTAVELVDLIRSIVRSELNTKDSTVLGQIVQMNVDGSYDLYIEPDMNTVVHGMGVIAGMPQLNPGDYVYVYKIENKLQNAFIIRKI